MAAAAWALGADTVVALRVEMRMQRAPRPGTALLGHSRGGHSRRSRHSTEPAAEDVAAAVAAWAQPPPGPRG